MWLLVITVNENLKLPIAHKCALTYIKCETNRPCGTAENQFVIYQLWVCLLRALAAGA